jgi:hypothetical protein
MAKKDLASVTTDLSALASMMPTQRPVVAAPRAAEQPVELRALKAVPKPNQEEEGVSHVLRRKRLQPWQAGHKAGPVSRPLRAGGKAYRGVNVLMLWAAHGEGLHLPLVDDLQTGR